MNVSILIVLSCPLLAFAEWIETPAQSSKGHLVPAPDYAPNFPRDHGSHPEYGIEWWYWVGHLQSADEQKTFGFQFTVFRIAGDAEKAENQFDGFFGNQNLFLVHSALSDLESGEYLHLERVYREGWQARASSQTLNLSVGGIQAHLLSGEEGQRVVARYKEANRLELSFRPTKPLVPFGDRGLSRKGADPAAVSWYWSYTRLQAEGILIRDGVEIPVKGTAWMDHEISSSQLGGGLEGWDWTCMQLDDGTEIKAYRLRTGAGESDPWSAVYWIDGEGGTERVYADGFSWEAEDSWTSPNTGLEYPTSVKVTAEHPVRGKQIFRLRPLLDGQEFTGNRSDNAYWEGACEVLNERGDRIGKAYLELAGYGGGLGARLN
ncbi:MAG: lipocalin-like domain-containing protein [Candidatus Latescibacterota bacterium]